MTVISESVKDIAGLADNTKVVFHTNLPRENAAGDGIITPRRVTVTPTNGVLTTPSLDPGPAKVFYGVSSFDIVIPTSGPVRLWPLIEQYIPVDGPQVSKAVAAALEATAAKNAAEAILDQVEAGVVPNSAVAAAIVTGPTKAALDQSYAPQAIQGLVEGAQTFVVAGDSIANQCETEAIATTNGFYSQYSWTNWANVYLGYRLVGVGNAGITGNRSSQLLARLDTDVLSIPSDWVFLSVLVNDLFDGTGTTVAQMKTNMAAIFEKIAAAGRMTAILLPSPSGFANATSLGNLYEMHRWLRQYAREHRGIVVVDSHGYAADPADGLPISGYSRPGDASTANQNRGVHPGYLWASKIGRALSDALEPYFVRAGVGETPSNADPTNVCANGRMLGGTTTPTGFTAIKGVDGSAATFTGRKVTRADGRPGEVWEIYIPPATWAAELPAMFYQDLTPGGRWSVGDTVFAQVDFETDPDTAGYYPGAISLAFWNGLGSVSGIGFTTNDKNATPAPPSGVDALPRRGTWRTPAKIIPASTGRLQLRLPLPAGTTRILSTQIRKVA